jgi:hypothetical protein
MPYHDSGTARGLVLGGVGPFFRALRAGGLANAFRGND